MVAQGVAAVRGVRRVPLLARRRRQLLLESRVELLTLPAQGRLERVFRGVGGVLFLTGLGPLRIGRGRVVLWLLQPPGLFLVEDLLRQIEVLLQQLIERRLLPFELR